jgi:hypothetical protein
MNPAPPHTNSLTSSRPSATRYARPYTGIAAPLIGAEAGDRR